MDYTLTILRRQAEDDPSRIPAYVRALERAAVADLPESK